MCARFVINQSKTLAVGRAVNHAGVGLVQVNLFRAVFQCRFATAFDFIFPTGNSGIWKPATEGTDNLWIRFKLECQVSSRGWDFSFGGVRNFVIGNGGGMKDGMNRRGSGFAELVTKVGGGVEADNLNIAVTRLVVGGFS